MPRGSARFTRMAGDIGDKREPWVERLPLAGLKPWQVLAIAGAIMAIAFAARVAIRPLVPVGSPFITFFPAVLLIGFLLGARRGVIAAAVSVALAAVFFMSNPSAPGYFATAVPSAVLFGMLASFNLAVFHLMQTANAKLKLERARTAALAQTRETLFRELQHRVSNNLQIAAGLLALQKKHVEGDRARAALEEASRRLGVIGRISRQLYESDGGPRSVRALLEPLCGDVVEMSGRSGVTLTIHAGEDAQLAPDAALPLALVVAEAVANAIEHGLAGRAAGAIDVAIGRDDAGTLTVEISDDGHGLPAGFDLATSSSLGLGIARTFAEQLGGSFELMRGGERTVARLAVPE
jgi:two-component system, sensor histidine kinase PdtaS